MAQNPRTRPFGNEWLDPQDKRIGFNFRVGLPPAKLMNFTLEVGALTDEKLRNYPCRTRNGCNYCTTKKKFKLVVKKVNKKG